MNSMKTVQDLRTAVIERNGELKIGHLRITHSEGGDIDFMLKDKLVMWIGRNQEDSVELGDVYANINSGFNDILENKKSDLQKVIEELTADLSNAKQEKEELEKKLKANELNAGKIEAYEKLLIGRDLTISK
jgi:hypothetical protein